MFILTHRRAVQGTRCDVDAANAQKLSETLAASPKLAKVSLCRMWRFGAKAGIILGGLQGCTDLTCAFLQACVDCCLI